MKKNIAIIGHGFVGKAVEYGFSTKNTFIHTIDPMYGNSVYDLQDSNIDYAFVCVPTPMDNTGKVDASIVIQVIDQLLELTNAMVILKSTITPDIASMWEGSRRVVYNPEFLTEANANYDFVNTGFHIVGGEPEATKEVRQLYVNYSNCHFTHGFESVTLKEASMIKYTINTFLATKLTFFNELYDLCQANGIDYDSVVGGARLDSRIGISHMQVPGPDGKRGFGGACLPKDTNALHHFSEDGFKLLKSVLTINDQYRIMYDLDEREKAMNVKFGDNE